MEDTILTGDLLFPHGTERATIHISDGRIESVDLGEISREKDAISGLIVPGLIDMHTHVGDHGARGHLPADLKEVVFPGGIKHGYLEGSSAEDRVASIRSSLKELSPGVSRILDFREGGIDGIQLLKRAIDPGMPEVHAFGRAGPDDDLDDLLEMASGIGMPSLAPDLEGIRKTCNDHNKPFAIHVSELFREDISPVLELEPDLVIHMVSGSKDDWSDLTAAGISVAVCSRANSAFSIDVPLYEMVSSGLSIGLGTDNAISTKQDMFREMEQAWLLLRHGGMEGSAAAEKVFSMASGKDIGDLSLIPKITSQTMWWESGWPRKGDRADMFVIQYNGRIDPFSKIVRFTGQKDIIWY